MDMIKNDIQAAMDRAIKGYIGRPVKDVIAPLNKAIHQTGISCEPLPKVKFVYYRCKCGKFCKVNSCKYCGNTDVKVCFSAQFPVPVENIELNFTV